MLVAFIKRGSHTYETGINQPSHTTPGSFTHATPYFQKTINDVIETGSNLNKSIGCHNFSSE